MAVGEAGPTNRIKKVAPFAGAAVAIAASVAAVVISSSDDDSEPSSAEPAEIAAIETPAASGGTPETGATEPLTTEPQPPQAGSAIPGVAQAPATTTPVTRPGAAAPQMGMEIVVKFKDDAKVRDIIDTFWKDEASARAKFEALKARRPEFASLRLDRVTYSNELVLVDDGSAPAAQRLTAMRGIAAKLKDVSDISYAEPNMTAHPGGK